MDVSIIGAQPTATRAVIGVMGVLLLVAVPTWSATPIEAAKVLAVDGAAGDQFGYSVALSGDTAVIGARFDSDDVNGLESGSAYVFVRTGTNWSQQAKLLAADGAALDRFGTGVSISGGTVVIGVPSDDDSGTDSGSAYVFKRNGANWVQNTKLLPDDGASDDRFGIAVSVSGDSIVVGSDQDDDLGDRSGSAYVFFLDSDGDGTPDYLDAFPLDPNETVDTDNDGIGNNADTDDDNDGTPDVDDAFPLDPAEDTDTDGDGIGNNTDLDDDNDGVDDTADKFPLDPSETVDTDGDGTGNNADADDDGDAGEGAAGDGQFRALPLGRGLCGGEHPGDRQYPPDPVHQAVRTGIHFIVADDRHAGLSFRHGCLSQHRAGEQ